MNGILKRDLVEKSESIFANTSAYAFQGGFANREESKNRITDWLDEGDACLMAISDLLGSGKTFLIQDVRHLYEEHPGTSPVELSRTTFLADLEKNLAADPPFLVIDEVDNKTSRSEVIEKLTSAASILNRKEHKGRSIIVLGDYSLNDDRIWNTLERGEPKSVPMEKLDQDFLNLALMLRLRYCLNNEDIGISEVRGLFDSEFVRRLIPGFQRPCAVFRQTLEILEVIGTDVLRSAAEPAQLTMEHFEEYFKESDLRYDLDDEPVFQTTFKRFVQWINEKDTGDHWDIDEFTNGDLAEVLGVPFNDDFVDDFVLPYAQAGLIRYYGVPYLASDGLNNKYPEPFLPSPIAILTAGLEQFS